MKILNLKLNKFKYIKKYIIINNEYINLYNEYY